LLKLADEPTATAPSRIVTTQSQIRGARQLRPDEVEKLVARYQEGAMVKDLAHEFGISRDTVCKHLNRREVERRSRGLRPEDVAEAARLYRAGWSLAKISEKFGTTDMTVRARLLEAGVEMRKAWER